VRPQDTITNRGSAGAVGPAKSILQLAALLA
jgi:hypothetical protein